MFKVYSIPIFLGLVHFAYIVAAIFFRKHHEDDFEEKDFSIEHIICFKNESRFVEKKLENCYSLDFKKIHHTFINDNSTDNTLELLNRYKDDNTMIISNETNLGKNQSQIKAVGETKSDLLLFSDANVFIDTDSLSKLIKKFNSDIGGISGNVTITTDMEHQDMSGKYWQLEKILKQFQSRFGSVIGFDGGFYCVKRKNYKLKRENELSDFETAFLIFEQGKLTNYTDKATAIELEKRKIKDSLKARMRASNRVFWSYRRIFKYIDKLSIPSLVHFSLHKLVRYLGIITYVISLPFIVVDLFKISPFLLLIFFIPQFLRFTLESIALCLGGIIALSGKEYRTWSHQK